MTMCGALAAGAVKAAGDAAAAEAASALQPVRGFEATAYAWHGSRLVWAGDAARCGHPRTDHPRNWHRPWQSPAPAGDAAALRRGARTALSRLALLPPRGLLPWLAGGALSFPLQLAHARLQAWRRSLAADDAQAFAAAAPLLLGLGPGLTPSGDDLLGGTFFALAHAPRQGWAAALAALTCELRQASVHATNPISAALLADLMHGIGYRVLHEWMAALQSGDAAAIDRTALELLQLGASSGADLMCGVLVTLASTPDAIHDSAALPPRPTPHHPA